MLSSNRLDGEAQAMTAVVRRDIAARHNAPWIWADWRLSLLGQFWSDAMSVSPAVIFVHRRPAEVAAARTTEFADRADAMDWWVRCNRSALVLCSRYPSLVVNYDEIASGPKDVLNSVVEFLEDLGVAVDPDVGKATAYLEAAIADAVTPVPTDIESRYQTLDRLLGQFDVKPGRENKPASNPDQLTKITAEFYDDAYYREGLDNSGGGIPYSRSEKHWVEFFAGVAKSIDETLHPRTVLDVGCALGMLVEALRTRGIDAHGLDISAWAIEQVPGHLKQFCRIGSVTEEIDGDYNLITCVEVLEHLPPSLADVAVANLCRHAEMVLFSSTPDDFDEPSHLNVEPNEYWAEIFLRQGFIRDFGHDVSFLAPHAILFRRREVDALGIVRGYERTLWTTSKQLRSNHRDAVAEHGRLAEEYNELAGRAVDATQLRQENARLAESLDNEKKRRMAETAAAYEIVHQFELGQRTIAGQLAARDAEISAIHNTKIFRYSTKLRAVYGRLRGRKSPATAAPRSLPMNLPDGTYENWIELFDTRDEVARQRIEARVRALASPPTISVIMPVYNPPAHLLRDAVESVRSQIYPHWELCIADDCSTDMSVVQLLEECAASDPRIKVVRRSENGHISAASNSALSLVTGHWVAALDHDDVLTDHALALVALRIAENPDAGLIYSDEDKIDEAGDRRDPFFKPDFDPLLLIAQNYICHLTVLRVDLVEQVGGYREGYEGSQDWDLGLRVSELLSPGQIVHIPHVLYHWRAHGGSTAALVSSKPYALDAGLHAVQDHLHRTSRSASVDRMGRLGHNRVRWTLPEPAPHVSIIVPTRDGRLLQQCIDSVLGFTIYPDFEVVVVDNSSRTYQTLSWLQGHDDRLTVLRDERPFNYAAINNFAVTRTAGDIVLLLNDDTEVMSSEWLTEMVSQLMQPGVGAVGAKLLYGDGRTVQHAGVILGVGGVAGHAHRLSDRLSMGYFGNLQLAHRVSAVTAACVAIRRQVWDQAKGMDEVNLPVAFNDVDLCMRIREAGWEIVWTPHAQLLHHESISRGPDTEGPRADAFAQEVLYMEKRWGFDGLRKDKYYNPNLSLNAEDFSLAWPPRESYDPRN